MKQKFNFSEFRTATSVSTVIHALERLIIDQMNDGDRVTIDDLTTKERKRKLTIDILKMFIDEDVFQSFGKYILFNSDYTQFRVGIYK